MAGTGFCHMVVVATFAMSQEVHVSNLQIFLMKLASYLAKFYKKKLLQKSGIWFLALAVIVLLNTHSYVILLLLLLLIV